MKANEMKLHVREWGEGDQVAVLLHGLFNSSLGYGLLGPELASRGYRVLAVDFPGHGDSPRADRYSIEDVAESLIASVPHQPALVLGHSLGGLVLSYAVEHLQPATAVYVDPGFSVPEARHADPEASLQEVRAVLQLTAGQIAAANPHWLPEYAEADAASGRKFDLGFMEAIGAPGALRPPQDMPVPSLLIRAENSWTVPEEMAAEIESLGFRVITIEGAGHSIDRDKPAQFLAVLDEWLAIQR